MDSMIIKPKTVVEQVMERIRELIASGRFGVSDQIPTESELAQMFGIGRSSIREAIKVFNYLGILESRKAIGTFVCDRTNISWEALTWSILLGNNDMYELIEMRESIEMWCLTALTEKYREKPEERQNIIENLEKEIRKMKVAIETGSMESLIEADYGFHSSIIRGSANTLFASIYDVLENFMMEEIKATYTSFTDLSLIVEEHQEFVDAIKSGEVCQVQEILVNHIRVIKGKLKKQLQKKAI